MKKEITPATAIVIVLIVLAVIGGIYAIVSRPKAGATDGPTFTVMPGQTDTSTGTPPAPPAPPPAPAPGQ